MFTVFHLKCLHTLMNVLKLRPSNVASKPTGRDQWTLLYPFIVNNEAPGALWNNRLAWTIWSCVLAAARVAICNPSHFESVGWVYIFRMLAMAGVREDLRNMQKFPKFLHELWFRYFFLCVGTWTALCLAFRLNFVLWIWPSYAWDGTLISAAFSRLWTIMLFVDIVVAGTY